MMLGLDERTKQVYEGDSYTGYGVLPLPVLSLATVIREEANFDALPIGCDLFKADLLFREDSFDAVTRIRRGRIYKAYPDKPSDWRVISHALLDGHVSSEQKRLVTFDTRSVVSNRTSFEKALIALGTRDAYSLWRVVSIERTVNGEDFLTLRARSSLGVLPELIESKVPPQQLEKVRETLNKLAEAAYRAGPESIVDRAKDAAQWAVGTWLAAQRNEPDLRQKDLAKIAAALDGEATAVMQGVSKALARLHARGKPNVQEEKGSRTVTEDDAEFSLATVGLLLREIGWAI
jgi:hypothetical protein